MYYREHGVPHLHATYAGETAPWSASQTGDVIACSVPAPMHCAWSTRGVSNIVDELRTTTRSRGR